MFNARPNHLLTILSCLLIWGCDGGVDSAPVEDNEAATGTTTEPDDSLDREVTRVDESVDREEAHEEAPEDDEEVDVDDEPCVSTPDFFEENVWTPLMAKKCIACHNNQGAAKQTKLVLQSSALTGYMEHNLATVQEVAAYEYGGSSILLMKPSQQMDHAGGQIITTDSAEYAALVELVQRFQNPVECVPVEEVDEDFLGVTLMDSAAVFRHAALLISGRAPTIEERAYLSVADEQALESLLDDLLMEETFYTWLKEVYNDQFHTDRYLGGDNATNLLNANDYPDRKWYKAEEPAYAPYFMSLGLTYANQAVAQEALELIVHVVRNGLPFTEILTADYMLLNPFSAISYGLAESMQFDDIDEPTEFKPAQLPGIPHAGVLTSTMFLNRFPTTDTNRNRHRSRMFYQFFLATDVMKLAERPIDPTSIQDHNPTMFNPDCASCHEVIDPLAGAFQNWTDNGRYIPPEEGWFSDMRPPAFGDILMPYEDRFHAVQWLAKTIAEDSRFALATVRTLYTGLTGHESIKPPNEEDEIADFASYKLAFDLQDELFKDIAQEFATSGYDIRVVLKALLLSPYFRAQNGPELLSEEEEIELKQVGTGRLSTPEQLHRRIEAVTGFPWRGSRTDADNLLTENRYEIFYGGIDSEDITRRIGDPNGIMVAVQARMANEMSCLVTTRDFSKEKIDRMLFPYVEHSYVPEDANGFPIPQAEDAIRENIRYLHAHMLGEELKTGDPEPEFTYQLFYDTWKEGVAGMADGSLPTAPSWACRSYNDWWTDVAYDIEDQVGADPTYSVRAWAAVISYLLTDYRFLYQ